MMNLPQLPLSFSAEISEFYRFKIELNALDRFVPHYYL